MPVGLALPYRLISAEGVPQTQKIQQKDGKGWQWGQWLAVVIGVLAVVASVTLPILWRTGVLDPAAEDVVARVWQQKRWQQKRWQQGLFRVVSWGKGGGGGRPEAAWLRICRARKSARGCLVMINKASAELCFGAGDTWGTGGTNPPARSLPRARLVPCCCQPQIATL